MPSTIYSVLNKSSGYGIVWECNKCGMPNFPTTLLILHLLLTPNTDLIPYHPCLTLKAWYQMILATAASLPIVQDKNDARTKTAKTS